MQGRARVPRLGQGPGPGPIFGHGPGARPKKGRLGPGPHPFLGRAPGSFWGLFCKFSEPLCGSLGVLLGTFLQILKTPLWMSRGPFGVLWGSFLKIPVEPRGDQLQIVCRKGAFVSLS